MSQVFCLVIYVLLIFFAVQEEFICDDVEFLVLASDGLWDVVSNQVRSSAPFV